MANAINLNHHLTENSAEITTNLRRKALAYNIAEKISWVAFAAITATVLSVYYTGTILTGLPLIALTAAILASPFLLAFLPMLKNKSVSYSNRVDEQNGIARELQNISYWTAQNVSDFLQQQNIEETEEQRLALQQLNPEEPLLALLPLIARFNYFKAQAEDAEIRSQRALHSNIADSRIVRLVTLQEGYRLHECAAIPKALNAAILLEIIRRPFVVELNLPQVGAIKAKNFEERMFDRQFAPINDDYFVFHPDLRHPNPITLQQIEQNIEPRALRALLFPNPVLNHGN